MPNSTQVTLKQLRYFARIVELGSISRASQDLHIAQTALGLQVRALETNLGVSLLLRQPKGVSATEEGKFVYERSLNILGAVDDLTAEVQARSGAKPRDIWLGLAPNLMSAIGTQAVLTQAQRIPGFRLHLFEASRNDLLSEVQNGELDWAILHEAEAVEGCRAIPILRQSVLLVCRPGSGLPPGPVMLRDVLARDLVLDSGRRVISGVLAKAAQAIGMKPKVKFEVDSVSTIKHMILTEGLSGLFNRSIVLDEIARGELEGHQIIEPPLDITAYFVVRLQATPRAHENPVLQFIDELLDALVAEDPSGEVRLGRLVSIAQPEPVK